MATVATKRKLKAKKVPSIYQLGETGKSWQDTQPRARRFKLRAIGASDAQIDALVARDFYALSRWVRKGLKIAAEQSKRIARGGTLSQQLA